MSVCCSPWGAAAEWGLLRSGSDSARSAKSFAGWLSDLQAGPAGGRPRKGAWLSATCTFSAVAITVLLVMLMTAVAAVHRDSRPGGSLLHCGNADASSPLAVATVAVMAVAAMAAVVVTALIIITVELLKSYQW